VCVDCQEGTCRMGIDTVHLQCLCVLTFPKQIGSIITVLCRSVLCGNITQVQWADHNHELHYLFSNRLVALSHIAYVGYNRALVRFVSSRHTVYTGANAPEYS
jgi:hypothetical protein